jgi:hypothetical protein
MSPSNGHLSFLPCNKIIKHVISPFGKTGFAPAFTMSATLAAVQEITNNPALHEYLAIVKGARNGLVYGAKVRFPHALVMSVLFGRGT